MAGPRFQKPCVILNPTAASGRAHRQWPLLRSLFEQELGPVRPLFTEAPGHAIELCHDAILGGAELVVAIGGDGTLSEVVNGYFRDGTPIAREACLGLCPFGTGGDFRRSAGIPSVARDAIAAIASREARTVDACRLRIRGSDGATLERYFLNTASFGMGGEVATAAKSNFLTPVSGKAAFLWATALSFLRFRPKSVDLTIGADPVRRVRIMQVALGNGAFQGGGMQICPRATLDSGQLEITVVEEAGLLTFLGSVRLLYSGKIYSHPRCHHYRATRILASSSEDVSIEADGEAIGGLPLEGEVLPGAVRMAGIKLST